MARNGFVQATENKPHLLSEGDAAPRNRDKAPVDVPTLPSHQEAEMARMAKAMFGSILIGGSSSGNGGNKSRPKRNPCGLHLKMVRH